MLVFSDVDRQARKINNILVHQNEVLNLPTGLDHSEFVKEN
jgi:hypothetical protein